ncbi:uncharacterized protein LOC134841749 [Symsagittifera roscoffensis]|uniref:uncharacterized protein LOC134841749 n=1 Tax=Symsagittifera roscoffensis TaxID=84072 RepID=UPI00307B8876
MCVTEHLCEPHGQCSKVKGRSSQLGHVYRCNCSEGYRDDPTSPVPDCTILKQSLFAYRDYTPPFVYYVIVGCCVVSIMLAYFIVHMEKRRKRPGKLNQKRLKRENLREHLEKKQRPQSSSGQSETGT